MDNLSVITPTCNGALHTLSGGEGVGKNWNVTERYIDSQREERQGKIGKTVHDVDVYRYQKAYLHGEKFIPSHYDTLKELYGEKKADMMLGSLEVRSWKFGK